MIFFSFCTYFTYIHSAYRQFFCFVYFVYRVLRTCSIFFNQIFDNFRKDDEKFLFLKIHFYCVFSFVNLKMFLSNPLVTIFYLLLYIKSDKGLNMNSVDLR